MLLLKSTLVSITCLCLLYSGTGKAQIYNTEIEAKITVEEKYNGFTIQNSVSNKTEIDQSLRYDARIITGNTNDSVESKTGRIVLAAGEQSNLDEAFVNKTDSIITTVLLLVYNIDDELRGMDRIVLHKGATETTAKLAEDEEAISPDATHTKADGVILRGIVIEDSKTKLGSDFYRMFYSDYLQKNINGTEIVTIKEALTVGNNTKIEILAGRDLVFQFIIKPQNEYLLTMKEQAIKMVRRYFYMLEKNNVKQKWY